MSGESGAEEDSGETSNLNTEESGVNPRIDHTSPKNRNYGERTESSDGQSGASVSGRQETFADRESDDSDASEADDVVEEIESDVGGQSPQLGDGFDLDGIRDRINEVRNLLGGDDTDSAETGDPTVDSPPASTEVQVSDSSEVFDAAINVVDPSSQTTPEPDDDGETTEGPEGAEGSDTDQASTPAERATQALKAPHLESVGGEIVGPDELSSRLGIQRDLNVDQDDLTPDAPDGVNLDNAVRFRLLNDGGASEKVMFLAATADGDVAWVTPKEGYGSPRRGGAIQEALYKGLDESQLDGVEIPQAVVDEEREAVVVEDAGPGADMWDNYSGPGEKDPDGFLRAAAIKHLGGDNDISGNIVVADDGVCRPIDFDLAGTLPVHENRPTMGTLDLKTPTDKSVDNKTYGKILESVASAIDVDTVQQELDDTPDEYLSTDVRNTIIDNLNYAQEGNLSWLQR